LIVLAVTALAIAACHGSSVSPSPSSSPASPNPNPSITTAKVLVTINGTPRPHIPVNESTPSNPASPRPGKTIVTEYTRKLGVAHFSDLKPSKTYCWVALLGQGKISSECAGWPVWQSGEITLGT